MSVTAHLHICHFNVLICHYTSDVTREAAMTQSQEFAAQEAETPAKRVWTTPCVIEASTRDTEKLFSVVEGLATITPYGPS